MPSVSKILRELQIRIKREGCGSLCWGEEELGLSALSLPLLLPLPLPLFLAPSRLSTARVVGRVESLADESAMLEVVWIVLKLLDGGEVDGI